MKKTCGVFVFLLLCSGGVIQPMEDILGLGTLGAGTLLVINYPVESLASVVTGILGVCIVQNHNKNEFVVKMYKQLIRNRGFDNLIKSNLSEELNQRINAIVNQTYQVSDKTFDLFPTKKSKIFVLQNIEDFFEFQSGNDYKKLNQFVYEAAIKKIGELERNEQQEGDFQKKIDEYREYYMARNDISPQTLQKMTQNKLENTIGKIESDMKSLIKDNVTSDKDGSRVLKRNDEFNPRFNALLSILAHLMYKQSTKKETMFTEKELTSKANIAKNKEEKLEQLKKDLQNIQKVNSTREEGDVNEAKQNYEQKYGKLLTLQAAKQKMIDDAAIRGELPIKTTADTEQAASQSIFSKMRSAWNSWWYGRK
jgi:hypothetical protein